MTQARLKTGRQGEEIASRYLRDQGYLILERNFRCSFGEMDIVARQGDVLVFVEVRSRRSDGFGEPLDSVGPLKQRKLSRIALCYIQKHRLQNRQARFDVLGVKIRADGHAIELVQDAFDLLF
jgi:putative endonuclease